MRITKTSQGRSALYLAFKAFAKKNKKFIVTQAFTCVAVPESIIAAGYKPIWADIELSTFSISEKSIENILSNYVNDIGCILIQHTYGLNPKNYLKIKSLASEFEIPIVEDRCHCNFLNDYLEIVSNKTNKKVVYCYSFENAKPINLGRGGLLLTDNESKKELLNINYNFNYFKKQNVLKSIIHFSIAINYKLFSNSPLYWPLLHLYRRLADMGFLPKNFNSIKNKFVLEKIGILQSIFISFFIFLGNINKKGLKNKLLCKLSDLFTYYFLKRKSNYPIYVDDKKKVLNFCKHNFIYIRNYFNSPIQPLSEEDYDYFYYKNQLCKFAEEAAAHVVVFDKKPDQSILSKIKSL